MLNDANRDVLNIYFDIYHTLYFIKWVISTPHRGLKYDTFSP